MKSSFVDHDRDTLIRRINFVAANTIAAGDMVFEDPSNAGHGKSIVSVGYKDSLAATQRVAALRFLGVAVSNKSGTTDAEEVAVAKKGIFELTAVSATYELGDLVGVDDNVGGTALIQQVIGVTDPQKAIGKIARREATATTTVLVEIFDKSEDAAADLWIREDIAANGTIKVFEADAPFKLQVVDFHIICTDANAGTVKLTDGTSDITDALTHGTTDKAIVRVGTIDDAKYELAKNGSLNIVTATGGKSVALIHLKRV